jgi:hypothetical protein
MIGMPFTKAKQHPAKRHKIFIDRIDLYRLKNFIHR